MDPRIRLNASNAEMAAISTLLPTRRNEILRYLEKYESNADELIDDPQVKGIVRDLVANHINTDKEFLNLAGKGYRKAGEQLTRGTESGRVKLVPDTPVIYSDEEQDLGELLALQKEYDFQMSGNRDQQQQIADGFLANKLKTILSDQVTTASRRATGMGGVSSEPKRKNHPDLPEITLDNTLPATDKFMLSNLLGNEIGMQSIAMVNKDGRPVSLPIEHTMTPFSADPSKGIDVDNRDLGNPRNNAVLRGEVNTERIAELLYNKMVDKADFIAATYGVTAEELMLSLIHI